MRIRHLVPLISFFFMYLILVYAAQGAYSPGSDEIDLRSDNPIVLEHEKVHQQLWLVSMLKPYTMLGYLALLGLGWYRWAESAYLFHIFTKGSNELTAYLLTGTLFSQSIYALIIFQNLLLCYYLYRNTHLLEKKIWRAGPRGLYLAVLAGLSFAVL